MPRKSAFKCYFGCTPLKGTVHHFPPSEYPNLEKFNQWKSVLSELDKGKGDTYIYNNIRICDNHFEECYRTANGRLTKNAIPTLNIASTSKDLLSVEMSASSSSDRKQTSPVHQVSTSHKNLDLQAVEEPEPKLSEPQMISPKHARQVSTSHKNLDLQAVEEPEPKLSEPQKISPKHARQDYRPRCVSRIKHTKEYTQLKLKLLKLRGTCKDLKQKVRKAAKISQSKAFLKAVENLPEPAAVFVGMQLNKASTKPRGRRYTTEEKILSLTIYKQSQKAYNLMRRLFALPSKRSILKVLNSITLKPGVNRPIIENLKKTVKKLHDEKKICTLIFDEVSLSPGLFFNKTWDEIIGFEDFGGTKTQKIADHALVFMIKGLKGKYKQPICFTFCQSATKTTQLKNLIKTIIHEVHSTGLKVIATVCDQSSTNVSVINSLKNETKQKYLSEGKEYRSTGFEIDGEKIFPVFDPPHLLKGLRNNLLTKDLRFIQNGEVKLAKWDHLKMLFDADVGEDDIRLVNKLTECHVNKEKIPKMKVKHAAQVFSQRVSAAMRFLANHNILPKECLSTADLLLLRECGEVAGTWRDPGCAAGGAGGGAAADEAAARRRRWQPSARARDRDDRDADANNDLVFRKVRGILNKLTPEKFQKLSDDLLALDLTSDKVLKGVILLIFDKALDEPKYSSMYAQLCKRLSEEAPNLEPAGQPCTFRLLLLNKCRAEFENRALAFAAFDEKEALTPDEEEKRHLAKCKMLGNIKFIGELGKLEILAESILHRCIQKLLARRGGGENVDDLECLAQLVRTCGRVLDSARGRRLVDQYFARMAALAAAPALPPRIRFMLRDVVELRRGGWVPRAAAAADPPVPITQLGGPAPGEEPRRDPLFRRAPPMAAVLAGLPSSHAHAQAAHPIDKLFSNGFSSAPFRHRSAPNYFPAKPANKHQNNQNTHNNHNKEAGAGGGASGGALGAGARRRGGVTPPAEVQMRPAANSLLFSAKGLSRAAPAAAAAPPPPPAGATFGGAALAKEPAIAIKPAPDKTAKPKKDKGISKEEAVAAALAAGRALAARGRAADPAPELRALAELQLPDKLARRAAAALLEWAAGEAPAEGVADAAADPAADAAADEAADAAAVCGAACVLVRSLRRAAAADTLRAAAARRPPPPRLASLLALAVHHKLVPLAEVASWLEGGQHYPLLLDVLQALCAETGPEALRALYAEAKVSALEYVRAGLPGAGDDAALAALEARGLGALEPQLRVGAALGGALAADPAPPALYRWIKAHVEPATRQHAAFVSALVAALAAHVASVAPAAPHDKAAVERERALVAGYAPLLRALLQARPDLQLAAVYAVQVHAHRACWARGALLRWFMYLYNLEVCDEDTFLRWREDVADARPGKGEALFQVNTWLTWLQQQDSDDDDADD